MSATIPVTPPVPYSSTRPPPPRTGLAVTGCYAACLNDCGGVLSREHYISESVLEELGELLDVTSPKFGNETKRLRPAALQAKILCERHNGALSPLDAKARDYFRVLRSVESVIEQGDGAAFFNGADFERWLLKVLCGFICRDGDDVPELWARILFGECDIVFPRGLQMHVRIGATVPMDDGITFETARDKAGERVGCLVSLDGFDFVLSMNGDRLYDEDDLGKQSIARPAHIRWTHATTGASYVLAFFWYPQRGDGIALVWTPSPA